jgi:hypothetical protein
MLGYVMFQGLAAAAAERYIEIAQNGVKIRYFQKLKSHFVKFYNTIHM